MLRTDECLSWYRCLWWVHADPALSAMKEGDRNAPLIYEHSPDILTYLTSLLTYLHPYLHPYILTNQSGLTGFCGRLECSFPITPHSSLLVKGLLNSCCKSVKWKWSRSVVSDSLWPHGLSPPGSSIHRIFLTRGLVIRWSYYLLSKRNTLVAVEVGQQQH